MRSLVPALVLGLTAATLSAPIATPASAQTIDIDAGTYVNDPLHTNVMWKVNHFGTSTYIGRFAAISATLDLDPQDVAKSKLTASVDPASVDTHYPADDKSFDDEIESDLFLDAAKFPEAKFVSKSIEVTGDKTGRVTGELTLHGETHEEVMDVTFNKVLKPNPVSKLPTIGFSATLTFDRTKYGIDAYAGPVGKDVTLEIETEFVPKKAN
ncbi:polyisoprenoid-binding protein [Jiella endophytica]|uniref:Polyisoprenoid-binding protein n=1 Tax=Jiella endophytica TaxID=2558362 RepID=A0A4Y8RU30_9HYPH|nr:YceI family protein [Jiella endophytica]TFF27463.1 polyisoprenoid-binding protein [Jiella endophytica]